MCVFITTLLRFISREFSSTLLICIGINDRTYQYFRKKTTTTYYGKQIHINYGLIRGIVTVREVLHVVSHLCHTRTECDIRRYTLHFKQR